MAKVVFIIVLVFLSLFAQVDGEIGTVVAGYGLCQTACNAAYVACCTAAGVTAGTVTLGVGVPAAVAACRLAQGACMAVCASAFLIAPVP